MGKGEGSWETYFDDDLRQLQKVASYVLASGYTTVVSAAISGDIRHLVKVDFVNLSSECYFYVATITSGDTATVVHQDFLHDRISGYSPRASWTNADNPKRPVLSVEQGLRIGARAAASGQIVANVQMWVER